MTELHWASSPSIERPEPSGRHRGAGAKNNATHIIGACRPSQADSIKAGMVILSCTRQPTTLRNRGSEGLSALTIRLLTLIASVAPTPAPAWSEEGTRL